jgi:hypothetical protein
MHPEAVGKIWIGLDRSCKIQPMDLVTCSKAEWCVFVVAILSV